MSGDRVRVDADALRTLLAARSEELAAEALQTGGQVEAGRLEQLGRLQRLVEVRDAAAARVQSRWTIPLLASVTLAAASVVLSRRVASTEIELELKVSELSFVVPTVQVLSDAMDVASVGLSGLRSVALPGLGSGAQEGAEASTILLARDSLAGHAGRVSLDPITVPAGTRVSLRKVEGPHRYRLMLQGRVPEIGVSVTGPVRVAVPPGRNEVRDFSFPRRVSAVPGPDRAGLEFATAESTPPSFAFRAPLPAESLFLFRLDRFQQSEQSLVRQVPTIQSGTLYFESLDGRARPLRAGEGLHLGSIVGELRQLELADDGFLLRFHGQVSGMSAGSGEVRRELMPTRLDWLRARHGLEFAWGAGVFLIGWFGTLLRWWRGQ